MENGNTTRERKKISRGESADVEAVLGELGELGERVERLEGLLSDVRELLTQQRMVKESYSTAEVAKILGKRPYTVREWCRLQRINAYKAMCGRGCEEEWRISHEELLRIQNEGLLPVPDRY